MGITEELADFSAAISIESLPAAVLERSRLLVLDLIGNAVRGRHDCESTPALIAAVEALGLARGDSGVFADARGYSPAGAALLNGALAHSLDFDDTHAAATLHPGAPVIPAAFAAAQMTRASGADVLAGVVAGYEVVCRVALALPAGDHYQRGFHPTATCGAFGAAAAAARVLGLDAKAVSSALGIALSQCAGSLQFLVDGAWTKRFQVGWAAMAGLSAAALARAGFKGPQAALEGKHGFLTAYAPRPTPERAVQNLGSVYELMATALKPYPSCRYGHAGIDAALELRAQQHLEPRDIKSVTYGLSRAGMLLVGAPADRKADPQSIVDGQFSAPFVLAVALATGRMTLESYELLHDPGIRKLMSCISCEYDAEIEAEFPANMSGKVTVRTSRGDFVRKVVVPRGEPGNFLTLEEVVAKFLSLCEPILGSERSAKLSEAALQVDSAGEIDTLLRLSVPSAEFLQGAA
jgi:2-methylcitrate dehydratase PrpD